MAQKITLPSPASVDNAVYQANHIEKIEAGGGRYNYVGYTYDNRIDFEIRNTLLDLPVEEV